MNEAAKGDVVLAGTFPVEEHELKYALAIEFESAEECRKALADGSCEFTIFGMDAG